jgi:signal transduction histidine kinase
VLEALRALARGIFPAILDEAGLGPALETLAELAPLPTEIRAVPEARLPPPLELAMYLVVQSAVEAANAAGASYAVVRVAREDEVVSTEISTDAAFDIPMRLQDRLGALGGRLLVGAGGIRAEAPCA